MKKISTYLILVLVFINIYSSTIFAANVRTSFADTDKNVQKAIEFTKTGELDKAQEAFNTFKEIDEKFIQGKYSSITVNQTNKKVTVKDLVLNLKETKEQIKKGDTDSALNAMNDFVQAGQKLKAQYL